MNPTYFSQTFLSPSLSRSNNLERRVNLLSLETSGGCLSILSDWLKLYHFLKGRKIVSKLKEEVWKQISKISFWSPLVVSWLWFSEGSSSSHIIALPESRRPISNENIDIRPNISIEPYPWLSSKIQRLQFWSLPELLSKSQQLRLSRGLKSSCRHSFPNICWFIKVSSCSLFPNFLKKLELQHRFIQNS